MNQIHFNKRLGFGEVTKMETTATVRDFENPKLNRIVEKELLKLKKSNIKVEKILDSVEEKLLDRYNIIRTQYEVRIKVDKRKNQKTVIGDIEDILNSIGVNFDIEYLLKIITTQSEIIIRARRKR